MAYLGNTPTTQSFISGTDYFNGTGSQTAFTLSRTVASINDIQVTVNNVVQQPNDAYTISGTTLTMTSAPSAGTQNVYVRYLSTTTQAITPSQGTVSWSTLNSDVQQDLGISFKNRIINGAMVINQRALGTTTINSGSAWVYTLDRWSAIGESALGVYTLQQSSTAPAGFVNSLLATVTTSTTPSSGHLYVIRQVIEGYNVADLGWGTASAKTVTLSFQVYSSLTGTFGGAIGNSAGNRSYPFTYTVSSANTWTSVSITITGDTSGTWSTTSSGGLYVYLGLGVGSASSGTAGAWAGALYFSATGATNIMGTNGATFYLTGVQLEVGTQATTFTTAGGSYGAELALCQRYYQQYNSTGDNAAFMAPGYCDTSSRAFCTFQFPVYMRSAPSLTVISATAFALYNVPADTVAASSITLTGGASTNGIVSAATITVNSSGVFTAGRGTVLKDASTSSAGRLQFSAEL